MTSLVFDVIISASLKFIIGHADGLSADLAHDPDFVATMSLVESDELVADSVRDLRQQDDWGRSSSPRNRGCRQPSR